MVTQLSKTIKILCIFCLFLSCKNDAQEKNILTDKNSQTTTFDFFQKVEKEYYTLIIDESNISSHPQVSHLDCKNEGYFTIHYVPKSDPLSLYWKEEFLKNRDFTSLNLEKDNLEIRKKIRDRNQEYSIFSIQITNEYLDSSNGCTIESIFAKKGSKANVYGYNQKSNEWELLKKMEVDFLPPYAGQNFFVDNFPQFFPNRESTNIKFNYNLRDDEEQNPVLQMTADLDKDKMSEKIVVLRNTKSRESFDQEHFHLPVRIYKDSVLWKSNNNLISDKQNNCVSEGFGNIVVKNNFFTIEQQMCFDYNVLVSSYITFKYINKEIFLYKYGESYFDKSNHEKNIPSKEWSEKDFGKIKFEDVNVSTLINLRFN